MDKKYINIAKKIEKLINKSKLEQATAIIDEYHHDHIAPIEFTNLLVRYEKIIQIKQQEKNNTSHQKELAKLSQEKFYHYFLEHLNDNECYKLFITKYLPKTKEQDLGIIEDLLVSDLINEKKVIIIEMIKKILPATKTNHIPIFNIRTKDKYSLGDVEPSFYRNVYEIIQKLLFKEPSLINITLEIITNLIVYDLYRLPPFDESTMSNMIISYTHKSLGEQTGNLTPQQEEWLKKRLLKTTNYL